MPRLRVNSAEIVRIRAEETESAQMLIEPRRQRSEHAARRKLFRQQLHTVAVRHRRCVVDIDLGAPVVPAAAGDGRPYQNRLYDLLGTHTRVFADIAVAIIERPLPPKLSVPD